MRGDKNQCRSRAKAFRRKELEAAESKQAESVNNNTEAARVEVAESSAERVGKQWGSVALKMASRALQSA